MQEASKKEAKLIGIAMIAGLIAGLALYFSGHGELAAYIKPIGTVFIRLLKMVIVPLVLSSIFMAMYHLGTPESLGSMGRKAVGYYFLTTAMAVFFGLIMVNLINPGVGVEGIQDTAGLHGLSEAMHQKVTQSKGLYQTILDVIINAIPTNPFEAMATSTVLQVIVFAIMFGIVALYMPKKAQPIVSFMESLEAMTLRLILLDCFFMLAFLCLLHLGE